MPNVAVSLPLAGNWEKKYLWSRATSKCCGPGNVFCDSMNIAIAKTAPSFDGLLPQRFTNTTNIR